MGWLCSAVDEEAEMMARREEDLAGKLEGENVEVLITLFMGNVV